MTPLQRREAENAGVRGARRGVLAFLLVLSVVSPTIAQPLTRIEVLLDWKALPTYAGFFLAKDLGAFERRGLVPGSITNGEFRALVGLNRLQRDKIQQATVDWDPLALLERKVDAMIDYEEMTPRSCWPRDAASS